MTERNLNPEHSEISRKSSEFVMRSIARHAIARVVFKAAEMIETEEPHKKEGVDYETI